MRHGTEENRSMSLAVGRSKVGSCHLCIHISGSLYTQLLVLIPSRSSPDRTPYERLIADVKTLNIQPWGKLHNHRLRTLKIYCHLGH